LVKYLTADFSAAANDLREELFVTIPQGPRGRKIILDFEEMPEKPRQTSWARYVLSAGLLIASGFVVMALLIKPAIQHHQVADKATPQKAADSSANQPSNTGAASFAPAQPDSTVVHNGVTVVTPHLLVPAVSDAAAAEESAALSNQVTRPAVAKTRTARRSHRSVNRGPLSAPWFNPTKQVVRY
jgi:hypothetical protein